MEALELVLLDVSHLMHKSFSVHLGLYQDFMCKQCNFAVCNS
jgi:hypothetical protein